MSINLICVFSFCLKIVSLHLQPITQPTTTHHSSLSPLLHVPSLHVTLLRLSCDWQWWPRWISPVVSTHNLLRLRVDPSQLHSSPFFYLLKIHFINSKWTQTDRLRILIKIIHICNYSTVSIYFIMWMCVYSEKMLSFLSTIEF